MHLHRANGTRGAKVGPKEKTNANLYILNLQLAIYSPSCRYKQHLPKRYMLLYIRCFRHASLHSVVLPKNVSQHLLCTVCCYGQLSALRHDNPIATWGHSAHNSTWPTDERLLLRFRCGSFVFSSSFILRFELARDRLFRSNCTFLRASALFRDLPLSALQRHY